MSLSIQYTLYNEHTHIKELSIKAIYILHSIIYTKNIKRLSIEFEGYRESIKNFLR